jgi:hypothetical protein
LGALIICLSFQMIEHPLIEVSETKESENVVHFNSN